MDIPQSSVSLLYNQLTVNYPNAFMCALAQQKDSLSEFTYETSGSKRRECVPNMDFGGFSELREIALSFQTQGLQAAILSQNFPPALESLRLHVTAKQIFEGLEQIHIQAVEQVLTSEEVSERLASSVSLILLPRFSKVAFNDFSNYTSSWLKLIVFPIIVYHSN